MTELLPHIVPLLSVALLQSRFVRGLLFRIFPGLSGWACFLLPWSCR